MASVVVFEYATLTKQLQLRQAHPQAAPAVKGWCIAMFLAATSHVLVASDTYPLLRPDLLVALLSFTSLAWLLLRIKKLLALLYLAMCLVEEITARYILLNVLGSVPSFIVPAGTVAALRTYHVVLGAILFGSGHLYHGRDDQGGSLALASVVISVPLGVLATTPGFGIVASVSLHFGCGMLIQTVDVHRLYVIGLVVAVLAASVVQDMVYVPTIVAPMLHPLVGASCVLSMLVLVVGAGHPDTAVKLQCETSSNISHETYQEWPRATCSVHMHGNRHPGRRSRAGCGCNSISREFEQANSDARTDRPALA